MITNKHITKIALLFLSIALVICVVAKIYSEELAEALGGTSVSMNYETELFDTEDIISLEIQMDEEKWEDMLADAAGETYYKCNVVVNGTTFYNVGIRPKGNTSLTEIASDPDSNRYSFKLEFDHYVDGQTCWGLDKLALNNNYADTTNMKEAIVYDMYQYLDADAPLYNYAKISVNDADWGIYLAVESVEDSFLLRNYGVSSGDLYKPDNMNMDGAGFDGEMGTGERPTMPDGEDGEMPDMSNFDPESMGDRGNMTGEMGGMMSGGGSDLNYVDDDLDSYSSIWEGAVTDSGNKAHSRVVKALKNIHEGTDIEQYLDVDNVLKYMAVHSFSVNDDSLSGSMAHNYYLYEENGKLNIIPWDYNLAFGGMTMGAGDTASDVVNDAIDTPFDITEFFDALLENEEYLERYHAYYQQLVDEYIEGGEFDETYTRIRSQIDEEVKKDPNALYTYEEYTAGADMLYDTIFLRAESVQGQLDGTIPSTNEGQQEDSSTLIDASSIDIDVMGAFAMGGEMFDSMNTSGELPNTSGTEEKAQFEKGAMPKNGEATEKNASMGEPLAMSGNDEAADSNKAENAIQYMGGLAFLLISFLFINKYYRKPHVK